MKQLKVLVQRFSRNGKIGWISEFSNNIYIRKHEILRLLNEQKYYCMDCRYHLKEQLMNFFLGDFQDYSCRKRH